MATHKFGIIDEVENDKNYSIYEPEKYNAIKVDDDLIEPLLSKFQTIGTYFHSLDRPEYGLAYCGVTIIPPESLEDLLTLLINESTNFKNCEFDELLNKVNIAIENKKYMIHFGI